MLLLLLLFLLFSVSRLFHLILLHPCALDVCADSYEGTRLFPRTFVRLLLFLRPLVLLLFLPVSIFPQFLLSPLLLSLLSLMFRLLKRKVVRITRK